jgi:hypothetical protein
MRTTTVVELYMNEVMAEVRFVRAMRPDLLKPGGMMKLQPKSKDVAAADALRAEMNCLALV